MAEIFLVRHAQASFESDDYDQLSPLGQQQSLWLGEYFAERDIHFDRVVIGGQKRHAQTLEGIAEGLATPLTAETNQGLNEYDFEDLFLALGEEHAHLKVGREDGKRAYYQALKQVLKLWQQQALGDTLKETWPAFRERVGAVLYAIQQSGARRVLIISSGGPIAIWVATVLQAPENASIELNLQLFNTGLSKFFFNAQAMQLASFNTITHLDQTQRMHAITYG
jgi:broad specificity phosphatase PhoE